MKRIGRWMGAAAAVAAAAVLIVAGQSAGQVASGHATALPAHIIVPQSRSFSADRSARIEIAGVKVGVVIVEQAATTTMDIALRNPTSRRVEAELLVPVPAGAAVRGFTFSGSAKEPTAELLPKEAAMETYKAIVAKVKDPAILEFAGSSVVRSSVFPVEANGTQAVRLTYEHLLSADGERIDYALPRTESIDYKVPWEVAVKIKSKQPISTVYSPSHRVECNRLDAATYSVKAGADALCDPGAFQISFLRQRGEVTASLLAYPDSKVGGGYFLLLAGLPDRAAAEGGVKVKREITVVLDRSGSMQGEKFKQAQAAALQVVEGLEDGESMNVIDYSDSIQSFAPAPVRKDSKSMEEVRRYLRRLVAGGGTNLHDALLEALRPKPAEGTLPIVLFLTDGCPTVGVRDEATIRAAAEKANLHRRRVFSFGVGYDVNAPLLSHLAQSTRATSTFVLPNEDVEAKVSQVFRRLYGPVLADPELVVVDSRGEPTTRRVRDLMPGKLPDLFDGDQLVLLGKYEGDEPLHLVLKGNFLGKPRTLKFDFPLEKATVRNNFVPRLWASRKIAALVDEIRQAGASPNVRSSLPTASALSSNASFLKSRASTAASDPRMKELVDEVVRLSVEHGVLTEYTAFLAKEGTDLAQRDEVLRQANQNFVDRAQNTRSGMGAVNQSMNVDTQRSQAYQNRSNRFYDANMNRVEVARVQQVSDRGFFQQGRRWVDGNSLAGRAAPQPDSTVVVGSPEFSRLVDRLAAENRQGVLAMSGEILIRLDGKNVLIKAEP
jgi:Ca-activated chloride channel family protein